MSRSNNSVVVDLLYAAESNGEPAAAAAAPAAGPGAQGQAVGVRVGVHDGYTRIVFDWTQNVDYTAEKTGREIAVRFNRPASFALGRLGRGERPLVASARAIGESDHVSVAMVVDEGTRLRHFRDGTKVVIDIIRGAAAQASGAASQAPVERQAAAAPAPAPAPPPPRQEPAAPRAAVAAAQPPASATDTQPAQTQEARAPAEPVGAPTPLTAAESRPAQAARRGSDDPLANVTVGFANTEAGATLVFEWEEDVAAAVYVRAGYYWAVFDQSAFADILPIPPDVENSVFLAEQVDIERGTAFRFKVRDGLSASVGRDGTLWRVDFSTRAEKPAHAIEVRREPELQSGARVFLPLEDMGKRVDITDPEVGDRVHVVPLPTPGFGVAAARSFAEFQLLASAQGVVVSPSADLIEVRPLRHGVEIYTPQGLTLSALSEEEIAQVDDLADEAVEEGEFEDEAADDPQRQLALAGIFKYSEWMQLPDESYGQAKARLNHSLATAPEGGRNAVRWELAKFYFANGMGPETLGQLGLILDAEPQVVDDLTFRAIRGAAQLMLGRIEEAKKDVLDPAFGLDPGAALWRGVLFGALDDWEAAHQEFAIGSFAYPTVPPDLLPRFQLAAARAAMLADDVDNVEANILGLSEGHPTAIQQSEADLITAQTLLAAGGDAYDSGLELLEGVIEAGYRPVRPWAVLDYALARLENGDITADQAIGELESQRHAWRGGQFEYTLLSTLSQLHLEEGDYRNALIAMRETATNFSEREETKETARQMNDIFRDLFLDHGADALEPVTALALYFDFRELTPVGRDGDAMIRQLADRLVEVDLLGRAAELVQHQVTFRLKGEEKARIGAKLAAVYILDKQPEKALEALQESRWRALPAETREERRHLQTQAFIDLQRFEDALELLKQDSSPTGAALRADISWRTSNWDGAAQSFRAVLDGRWEDAAPLSRVERQQVMQMTVALALSDDIEGIAVARDHFKKLMDETPDADAFEIITNNFDRSSTGFREVAGAIAQTGTLESFMARYRDKLEEGVGAIN